jgi:hypothetical protein
VRKLLVPCPLLQSPTHSWILFCSTSWLLLPCAMSPDRTSAQMAPSSHKRGPPPLASLRNGHRAEGILFCWFLLRLLLAQLLVALERCHAGEAQDATDCFRLSACLQRAHDKGSTPQQGIDCRPRHPSTLPEPAKETSSLLRRNRFTAALSS